MKHPPRLLFSAFVSLLLFSRLTAAEYFVAPDGKNTNPGTLAAPFATVQRAQESVNPGDTVFLRGGSYKVKPTELARVSGIYAYIFDLSKSGTEASPIKYWAYKDEKPVFDFSEVKPAGLRVVAFFVGGNWLHLRGFEVTGVQVTLTGHTQSESFENQGNHNIYERLAMHDSMAIGLYLIRGGNNLILNCDAYRNWDNLSENGKGGNTDGFGGHPRKGDAGNIFRGDRSWFNSDDGYDCINAGEAVTFDHCWSMYNGFSTDFRSLGDGNGFKAGGYGAAGRATPNPIPRHVVEFCLSVRNKASGFYSNHHAGGSDWISNTAFGNATNFNLLCVLADNRTNVPGYGHYMRNNLGFRGHAELSNFDAAKCDASHNYFDLKPAVNVTAADFVSLDEAQLTAPRQPDGSLPDITFMHLVKGSPLIDAGIDAKFPFKGARPDLGAFEYDPAPAKVVAAPAAK